MNSVMLDVSSIKLRISPQCLGFTVVVSAESLFASRYRLAITFKHFLEEFLFPWGSHYFLVNNDLGSRFSLVYCDWKSYHFRGVDIHCCT